MFIFYDYFYKNLLCTNTFCNHCGKEEKLGKDYRRI